MKVSIITVTYNAEKFLAKTIESILSQTISNYEYIIIDGASKDDTCQIIKDYQTKISQGVYLSIKYDDFHFINEPDKGIYDAMNKGLSLASGDFVWFINAGDKIYDKETLALIVDKYTNTISADIIYGQTLMVDEKDNVLGERHKIAPPNLKFKDFLDGQLVCHQSILVNKALAKDFDLKYRISSDYDWMCDALSKSKNNLYIDAYLSRFLTEGTSSKLRKKSWFERFYIMNRHFGIILTIFAHIKIILRYPFTKKY